MEHTKSFNTKGGKNRLRFNSSKARAKTASADIYRAHIGNRLSATSSTADREKRVHDGSDVRVSKKLKSEDATVRFFERENDAEGFGIGRSAVIVSSGDKVNAEEMAWKLAERSDVRDEMEKDEAEEGAQLYLMGGTAFLAEIEISGQRNGSQYFHKLIAELRPLCKSFAELLHHKEKIVDLLCEKLLSEDAEAGGYVANIATNDILHLLGVLARELRAELYIFLNKKIFPRIIDDMLNPPRLTNQDGQQGHRAPLDVAHIEAAFRCLSYLFKYDSEQLISGQDGKAGDADNLRQHYGKTVCHRRDIVRKLACEAYAPLLRKCSDKGLKRHLMRTVKALATSLANAESKESQCHTSNSMKRARLDAIDGVSSLLFEVARGAKRVHSKTGKIVIRSLMDCLIGYNNNQKNCGKNLQLETSKAQVVYEVSSQCLYKLRGHVVKGTPIDRLLEPSAFGGVFDEIHKALDAATCDVRKVDTATELGMTVLGHVIDLVTETVNFQEGRLIRDANARHAESDRIAKSLQSLLSNDVYSNANIKLADQILRLMCATWKVNPDHPSFSLRLGKFFPRIVSPSVSDKIENGLRPAIFLAEHLLPFIPQKVASESLIPSLLSAAATYVDNQGHNCDDPLILLHAIATTSWASGLPNECEVDPDDDAADSFFSVKAAEKLPVISAKVRRALMELCLRDDLKQSSCKSTCSIRQLSRVEYVARCIPFLECIRYSCDEDVDETQELGSNSQVGLAKILKWFTSTMKYISTHQVEGDEFVHVVQAFLLESFSKVAMECHTRDSSSKVQSTIRKAVVNVKLHANKLLFDHFESCWAMKGVAAFATCLNIIEPGSVLNDRANETYDCLASNLAQPDHFIRLYTLRILESYPSLPFVTDHADIDLTDDLEEEPDSNRIAAEKGSGISTGKSDIKGPCDIISVMKTLESIPIAFANERKLTSQIGRLEVYANTGKLPALYAECAVCHMLGLLHVKFAPIWPAAVRVIVALTVTSEDCVWPYVYSALQKSLEKTLECRKGSLKQQDYQHSDSDAQGPILKHHYQIRSWETSMGLIDIFTSSGGDDRQTVISRFTRTDESVLFQNLWSIMINAHYLTTTKSKQIVPIFFEFMIDQYYVFHSDDPDMREFQLRQIVESRIKWSRDELGRKAVQKKLESFLTMFAAVKGPQQLFKHRILLQMFIAFLSNPDPKLANLAFMCVQKFKLPYLMPYVDSVHAMLKKDELRDALAKFDLSVDSNLIDAEHRQSLIPVVTRILFGRFSSRGGKTKSAKDSPAARRAAILSFFSRMGNSNGELTHFIYMMVRVFIPFRYISDHFDNSTISLMKSIERLDSISSDDIETVPLQRQIGFLNLLSDVINQIGFGCIRFVPVFMNLLLTMSEKGQDALGSNIPNRRGSEMEIIFYDEENSNEQDSSNTSRLRTLTFLRLSEILTKFASSTMNFEWAGKRLWRVTSSSLLALPNTVINAENPPSLLRLIESISAQPNLIYLLKQGTDVIPCVFKCIAGTTRFKAMQSVLNIIDNLLQDVVKSIGQPMILGHIHLLISQFHERLQTTITKSENKDEFKDYSERGRRFNLEGLQTSILCRVSGLLLNDDSRETHHIQTMEDICGLLVPSLNFSTHASQVDLMRTVANFMPRLPANSAKLHYHALSKLLGPNKSQPGLSSSEMRQVISSALCAIGKSSPEFERATKSVNRLNAFSSTHIDEYDFERMLPVLNSLGIPGSEGGWFSLSAHNEDDSGDPRVIFPLLYSCLHMLHSTDAVIGRASSKALKTLITTCSEQIYSGEDDKGNTEQSTKRWIQFMERSVMPCLKIGLTVKADDTRRHFVLLVSHVARKFGDFDSPHLYGDLNSLIRDDDQDLDFFLNVTHLQLHRRVKALQRLRKLISSPDRSPLFSEQSYGNVLLPLALHPVYEFSSKADDTFAIEAIATVGVISRHLQWAKYHEALESVLNSLTRYPDKERHLVALLCAIVDAFHFSVETGAADPKDSSSKSSAGNGVWRSLKNRIIPKVESFLVKERIDNRGSKSNLIRPSVVLALVKLFQKLPIQTFEAKLPQLIKVISTSLKNKDSKERDIARETMAKMASSIGMKYLPLIISDLSFTLSHGYQLHVRAATLHSILVAVSENYCPNEVNLDDDKSFSYFDRCVPDMLNLIQQDIFGVSSEMKETDHVKKRLIKEALGSKSQDSLEIISKLIFFKPSNATNENRANSPAHVIVAPFIGRLADQDVVPSTIRKVKECLNKVAFGLSSNPSANIKEVLPFIYEIIAPFVLGQEERSNFRDELGNSDDDADADVLLQVTKTKSSSNENLSRKKVKGSPVKVSTWAPSTLDALESQRSALEMKRAQKRNLHKVTDGAAAPKLTGSSRHTPMKSAAKLINNPANASALTFGLTFLNACLKRSKIDVSDSTTCSMAESYLHLLVRYVRFSQDSNGIVLSLRALGYLLRIDLPSVPEIAHELSPIVLEHLTAWGAASNTQTDIVQGCFKTLTLLFLNSNLSTSEHVDSNDQSCKLPLSNHQMQALVLLLKSAVMESDHHNATFGLVKAICIKKYISPDFYDLMEIILKLSVQSQKPSVRLQSSQIFLRYLLDYPMGTQRLDNHLQQIVLNLKYEYEEGRLSAIGLFNSVIQKLPSQVLENHSQMFFLPLVLQLVNDDSKKCKESLTGTLSLLLTRLSIDTVQNFFGYTTRWSDEDNLHMKRAAAQLNGIFVESRPDFIKRGTIAMDMIGRLSDTLKEYIPFSGDDQWELLYYNILCIEKLNNGLQPTILAHNDIGSLLVRLMAYPHPWVMQASLRIVNTHVNSIDAHHFPRQGAGTYLVECEGCLYDMARNLCRQLDIDDSRFVDTLSVLTIKTITWLFQVMNHHPTLFYATLKEQEGYDEQLKNPCKWIMSRLSNIAKPKHGSKRRESIFKCYAALCTSCTPEQLTPYLRLMITSLDRAIREETNNFPSEEQQMTHPSIAFPKDVLNLLENVCGTEKFLEAYTEVNKRVREKKDKRKQDIAAEAVHNPSLAAKRKIKKQLHEKDRKKRRVSEMKLMRGVTKKDKRHCER